VHPSDRTTGSWATAICLILAVVAVAVGIVAVVTDEALLAIPLAAVCVSTTALGVFVESRRQQSHRSREESRARERRLRRQIRQLEAAASEAEAMAEVLTAGVGSTDDWEIDPVSGLLRESHLPVLLQQVVSAARRKVLPVSVVFWEIDGLASAAPAARDQAVTALGAVTWRSLRESDALFRLGDAVAVGVLVDTAEPGAVLVAERVRDALRASAVGDSLTVSAGIACYPTHALDAAELVSRAGRALEAARACGFARDHVAVAAPE